MDSCSSPGSVAHSSSSDGPASVGSFPSYSFPRLPPSHVSFRIAYDDEVLCSRWRDRHVRTRTNHREPCRFRRHWIVPAPARPHCRPVEVVCGLRGQGCRCHERMVSTRQIPICFCNLLDDVTGPWCTIGRTASRGTASDASPPMLLQYMRSTTLSKTVECSASTCLRLPRSLRKRSVLCLLASVLTSLLQRQCPDDSCRAF